MPSKRSRAGKTDAPHVVVVGAGISGMTAALRLLQRGYRVTIYEEKARVGGNLAGFEEDGVRYDVYPHLFGDWYRNFWDLVEGDLKLTRGDGDGASFEPRYTFKVLERGRFPNYIDLLNVKSPERNLFSGLASPADMFLWAYSSLDGLSYSKVDDDALDRISVEGFLGTRPYARAPVSALHDSILMTIWSVHSDQTSAAAYRRFVEHNVPLPNTLAWLLTGNLGTKLMQPLQQAIVARGGVFKLQTRVVQVVLGDQNGPGTAARVEALKTQATTYDKKSGRQAVGKTATTVLGPSDSIILAVSPTALGYLVTDGTPGERIVDKLPTLSEVRRLAAAPIPVLNLYFNRKLPGIPKENILLRDSRYDLTVLDLEQIWHDDPMMSKNGKRRTVLCVAASDYYALPSANEDQQKHDILNELREYIQFSEKDDVDLDCTYFDTNTDDKLFLNVVGGKEWQPQSHYPDAIANLFFAGDCTINPVRMATVESAVVSGLQAARGIWETAPLGAQIEIKMAEAPPLPLVVALKSWLAPWAYAAKCWSSMGNVLPTLATGSPAEAQAAMTAAAIDLWATPYLMAADVWQSIVRAAASGPTACAPGPDPTSR
jgi:hypothetical protein